MALQMLHSFNYITLVGLGLTDKDHVRGIDVDEVFEVEEVPEEALDIPGHGTEVIKSYVGICLNL